MMENDLFFGEWKILCPRLPSNRCYSKPLYLTVDFKTAVSVKVNG